MTTTTPANKTDQQIETWPQIIEQPWGDEYACCGGEAGSGLHSGPCGA